MADYTFDPSKDPARRGKASYTAGGNSGYPAQVASYNNWLYTPMDRRPTPTPTPPNPLYDASSPGWHGPTSTVSPGNYSTPYGTASVSNPMWNIYNAPTAKMPTPANGGAAGPDGPAGITGPTSAEPSAIDTAPKATLTPGAPTPPQNSMQRWSEQNSQPQGIRPISDQRRYFWSTRHIDARAPVSPQQSSPAPVKFKNSPSNWTAW